MKNKKSKKTVEEEKVNTLNNADCLGSFLLDENDSLASLRQKLEIEKLEIDKLESQLQKIGAVNTRAENNLSFKLANKSHSFRLEPQ